VLVRSGGTTRRVNPAGTYAQTGGIDGRSLYLQLVAGGRSRLARYDLRTQRLLPLPSWLGAGAWLWRPDADAGRLLYGAILPGRQAPLRYEIRLADLRARRVRVLADLSGHAEYAAPGQLRGAWATWVACPESTCDVWRENVRSGRAESAPDPAHLVYTQIAPAVTADGVVYFERTLASCGGAEIERWGARGVSTALRLPKGFAYQYGYASRDAPTLYFDLAPCDARADADIYALRLRR
jgi:hypothetical protein